MLKQKTYSLTSTPVVCAVALLCCLLWGSAFPCIKIGYRLFRIPEAATASQILFAGYRFTIAGLLILLIGSLLKKRLLLPKKSSIPLILKLGFVQTLLQYVLFYIGLAHTTGVKSSIIEASNVFVAIFLSALLFHEKLQAQKLAGCFLGFLGVIVINLTGSGLDSSFSLAGEGAIFFSACAYALSSAMVKRYSAREDTFVLCGWQFFTGGIVMSLAGTGFGGEVHGFTPASTALLLYMGLLSAVAYSLWSLLLKYNPIGKVSIFGFTNPLFGVILSALLLGEKNQAFTLKGLFALLLVCAGILLVNKSQGRDFR